MFFYYYSLKMASFFFFYLKALLYKYLISHNLLWVLRLPSVIKSFIFHLERAISVPYLKNLLHYPAMVSLQRLFIGFSDIDADVVGIVLISLAICQTLQQDLNEAQASEK